MLPLPGNAFSPVTWRQRKVGDDAHVPFERRYYSVPWKYLRQDVWLKVTSDRIYIYDTTERFVLAEHARHGKMLRSTLSAHMPLRAAFAERDPAHWQKRADELGASVRVWVDRQLEKDPVVSRLKVVQTVVLDLELLPSERPEKICLHALEYEVDHVAGMKKIIDGGLENVAIPSDAVLTANNWQFARSIAELMSSKEVAHGWQ